MKVFAGYLVTAQTTLCKPKKIEMSNAAAWITAREIEAATALVQLHNQELGHEPIAQGEILAALQLISIEPPPSPTSVVTRLE